MLAKRRQFLAEAIEYSLIAGGIALAIVASLEGIGPRLDTIFAAVALQLM